MRLPTGCSFALLALVSLPLRAAAQDQEDVWALMLADGYGKLEEGNLSSAENVFVEVLDAFEEETGDERPSVFQADQARIGLLSIDLRRGRYERVLEGAAEVSEGSRTRPEVVGLRARALHRTGRYDEAAGLWRDRAGGDAADFEARYELGAVLHAAGQRQAARREWEAAAEAPLPQTADGLAFHARCRWRLGGPEQVVAASHELVAALDLDPEHALARTTLGILNFEVYGEAAGFPSGERNLVRVLEEHGDVEEALLALYRLRSSNFLLDGGRTESYLERALRLNAKSVPALVLRGGRVLDDRRFGEAAEIFDAALAVDPRDREALAHRAAAAFVLGDREGYRTFRERAMRGDPGPETDRILADHLVALYRFADAVPFYEAAMAQDGEDVDTLEGMAKALIYTGQGTRAKELLLRAKAKEPGFVDPWRNNMLAVEALLEEQYVTEGNERFEVLFHRDDVEVLREYLMPLCLEAFEVLGKKYDHRPEGPVRVEVFHTWDDFSVRTIGFRGFTALGACFGRFLTLVSPGDSDLRKQDFMWEATVWHEYAHVLTLGLSRHRVPRWLTEGFSVYEERCRDPQWERGMDRELFDAFHNRDIPPVRLLNRLFRGERILFGYFQGGLIVDLIAREHGFDKALELLRAFGDDLDTEEAFERALGISSKEFDAQFLEFIEKERLRGMLLVPRFDEAGLQRLLVRAAAEPENLKTRVDLAWAFVQRDNPVDAGQHLAVVLRRDPEHAGALLVRAELLRRRGAMEEALECWRRGFAGRADDFDSRIAYGRALLAAGQAEEAENQFQRAKACWPGCTEQDNAPELLLARIYRDQGRREQALMEMKSYCRRTARAYTPRWTLAGFEREAGHREEELRYLRECNQIDPFRRELHVLLGECLEALERPGEAALEFEVAAAVPAQLDRAYLAPDAERPAQTDPAELAERGGLLLRAARLRWQVGEADRARALLERVLRTAPGSDAAAEAEGLQRDWRPR